jgi:alpha-1,6-mannosyltransferase
VEALAQARAGSGSGLKPAATGGTGGRGRAVVADVAMFFGEGSGGIRTYLENKERVATTGLFEHHMVVPGRHERHQGGRHLVHSLRLAASNRPSPSARIGGLKRTLSSIQPDFVLLHDPFRRTHGVTQLAHSPGAAVIAVHDATPALGAAGIPVPTASTSRSCVGSTGMPTGTSTR